MSPTTMRLDPAESTLSIRTRAKGVLSRLAHDLSIVARRVEGEAEVEEAAWSAKAEVPVASLAIEGVLKRDRVDTSVLSASDRADIARRLRDDALQGASAVRVEARGSSRDRGEVVVTVAGPSARVPIEDLRVREEAGALVAEGRCVLSLSSLGAPEIKGPLGAFKVADAVEVLFRVRLVR